MLGWLIRLIFVLAGSITSWFIARDALNFSVVQMIVVVILITLAVAFAAFWPGLKSWFNRKQK